MLKKIVFVSIVCFLLCGCTSSEKYQIGNANVNVQSIYFNDTETLVCSQSNPNYALILEQIEMISQQNSVIPEMGVFVHEPDITLVCDNGVTFELSWASSDAIIEYIEGDETRETYTSFYYIRRLEDGVQKSFSYYEETDAVGTLCQLKADAISHEYTSGTIAMVTGVVINTFSRDKYTECVIDSVEYDRIWLYVEDADGVIAGDTVSYEVTSVDSDTGRYYGTVDNLTDNDVTQTSADYITSLPFEYSIMTVPKEPEMLDVSRGRVETEDDAEYFDFILSLYDDRLPSEVLQELDEKYDETFFQDHFLLYYGMGVTEVEVTAVVQQEWLGGDNEVYIKELTDESVPENEHRIIWIEVPREGWNGYSFYGYEY